jgi:hypothetical protein
MTIIRAIMMVDMIIASQTDLASVMAMLIKITVIDARLTNLQKPENFSTPYKTNGNSKNKKDANRFLLAIVA